MHVKYTSIIYKDLHFTCYSYVFQNAIEIEAIERVRPTSLILHEQHKTVIGYLRLYIIIGCFIYSRTISFMWSVHTNNKSKVEISDVYSIL